jgi:lipoyl(octanoyl) transferase
MSAQPSEIELQSPALEAFLLGQVDFEPVLALQQRLVREAHDRGDGQITLLLCEHPAIITVGRAGSPGHIAQQSGMVRHRQIEVRWVNRGGGCMVHCPGQLAIYPIVPLRWHGFSVGQFLDRFQAALIETLADVNVQGSASRGGNGDAFVLPDRPAGRFAENPPTPSSVLGVWGRTGQLAAIGVAVRHWVTYYGAYLNVCPPMGLFRLAESDPDGRTQMSSLVAERRGSAKMTAVRAALVNRLTECFGCDRYHLYTGHPLLRKRRVIDKVRQSQ